MGHKGDYGAPTELLKMLHLTLLFPSLSPGTSQRKLGKMLQTGQQLSCTPHALYRSLLQSCYSWLHKEKDADWKSVWRTEFYCTQS